MIFISQYFSELGVEVAQAATHDKDMHVVVVTSKHEYGLCEILKNARFANKCRCLLRGARSSSNSLATHEVPGCCILFTTVALLLLSHVMHPSPMITQQLVTSAMLLPIIRISLLSWANPEQTSTGQYTQTRAVAAANGHACGIPAAWHAEG